MKMLFLSLIASFGMTLFASESTLYRDEDSGFVMQVPGNMKRTWNVSHCESEIELNVFQTDSDADPFYVVTTGKFSVQNFEGIEDLFSMVMGQLQENLVDSDFDDCPFQIEILPSLSAKEYPSQRMRLSIVDEDEGITIHIDAHIFINDAYGHVVATTMYSSENNENLEDFTKEILGSVQFVKDVE